MQLSLASLLIGSVVLATPLTLQNAQPNAFSFDLKAPKNIKRAFDHLDAEPLPMKREALPVPKKMGKRQIDYSQFIYPNVDSYGLSWCPATQQRYPSSVYTCYDTQLCKVGFMACGVACYSPMAYGCVNGQLSPVGGSSASPAAAATNPQVSGVVAASQASGIAVVAAANNAQASNIARFKRSPLAAPVPAPAAAPMPAAVPKAEAKAGGWLFGNN